MLEPGILQFGAQTLHGFRMIFVCFLVDFSAPFSAKHFSLSNLIGAITCAFYFVWHFIMCNVLNHW